MTERGDEEKSEGVRVGEREGRGVERDFFFAGYLTSGEKRRIIRIQVGPGERKGGGGPGFLCKFRFAVRFAQFRSGF